MWFFYALLSAIFATVRRTNEKVTARSLNHFSIGWLVQGLSLPVICLAMLCWHAALNPWTLGIRFWLPLVIIWVAYYPLNTYLYVHAYRHGEFSKILPLQSLSPLFSAICGYVAFGQQPAGYAVFAMAIIMVSVYVLNMRGRRMHNPLHMFTADRANLYMTIVIAMSAAAGVIDTIAIRASNPVFYSFMSTLGAVPVLFVCARLSQVHEGPAIRKQLRSLVTSGTFFGLSYTTYLLSISTGQLAYASAVRGSSMFMGAAVGILWLKESFTRQKLLAFVGMAAGLTLFALTA